MGKVEANKIQKKNTLFATAFELFHEKGFARTTISDIVNRAGLAKGTFYLYFKDKYDIRDKLIIHKTGQLLAASHHELLKKKPASFEESILLVADFVIEKLKQDRGLLALITKNLSWGVMGTAFQKNVPEESVRFYDYYLEILNRYQISCTDPELMLFTILELVGSTACSCILYEQPVSIDAYKPYLHRVLRSTIRSFSKNRDMEESSHNKTPAT